MAHTNSTSSIGNLSVEEHAHERPPGLDIIHIILISISGFTILAIVVLGMLWLRRYHSMVRTIQILQEGVPPPESQPLVAMSVSSVSRNQAGEDPLDIPLRRQKTKTSFHLPWKPPQRDPLFTKADLILLQLIKAGKEGVFYKSKITRGTCKGHTMVTCKIAKEGVTAKQMENEVSIMRKLVHHKNVIQLLDWNTEEEPYVLLMEFVSSGTLRSFLKAQSEHLRADPELQGLFTIASYHIALAMGHMSSKMVVHGDLALRNIMLGRFPWEVKVAEFGLARDLTHTRSCRGHLKKQRRERVPLRWYPPEYFRRNYYSFKGDVWAYGILLWEMQTFGTLPYPTLETTEEVVCNICAGYRNAVPDGCRAELLEVIQSCWTDSHTERPSFTDILRLLENTMENDTDYVNMDQSVMATGAVPLDAFIE